MTVARLIKAISTSKRYPLSKIGQFGVINNTTDTFGDCSYVNQCKIDKTNKTITLSDDKTNNAYTVNKFLKLLQSKEEIQKYRVMIFDYKENAVVPLPDKKSVEVSPYAGVEKFKGTICLHTTSYEPDESIFGW